ncbi:hypothetical protein HYH03_018257 [Edaphochlamys debaryana]|uniref:Uncharacterized protein n=1 Tax=Edaphochlamys debaryana TaxID=47281 RepID=A0A836BN33_9CHLO|nr:hypothetical protein HYH03_018257 [Edaphochlamys debaryana]|eukprot:KAG2482816.1 hypothetical protein HYH03_018257 [Edaphochlamys debaryana]
MARYYRVADLAYGLLIAAAVLCCIVGAAESRSIHGAKAVAEREHLGSHPIWASLPGTILGRPNPDAIRRMLPRRLQQEAPRPIPNMNPCDDIFPPRDCVFIPQIGTEDCSAATCPLSMDAATTLEDCTCATSCQLVVLTSHCTREYTTCMAPCAAAGDKGNSTSSDCPPSCASQVSVAFFNLCRCQVEGELCTRAVAAALQTRFEATCWALPARAQPPAAAEADAPPPDPLTPLTVDPEPDAAPPAGEYDAPPPGAEGCDHEEPPIPPAYGPYPPVYGGRGSPPPPYGERPPAAYGAYSPPAYPAP